jgi:hypothetical protein
MTESECTDLRGQIAGTQASQEAPLAIVRAVRYGSAE